jgi:hypothetical protein
LQLATAFLTACSAVTPAQDQPPPPPQAQAPAPASFELSGTVKSGKTPLPGVTVTATNSLTGKQFSTVTALNGTYMFKDLPRGRYVVKIEFLGFATLTQEVVLKPETPTGKFDGEMILASRQQQQGSNFAGMLTAGRGFQSLGMDAGANALGGGNVGAGSDIASLPMGGAGADVATESVSVNGAQGRGQDFGFGNEDDIQQRMQEFKERAQREGGLGGGGFGGFGGGPGGGVMAGPVGVFRMPRSFNINQPHGTFYVSDDNAAFDAEPYSLTGLQTPKASYNLTRIGGFLGGPLNIPHIYNGGMKNFYFVNFNSSHGSTPYDAFSTVPSVAERNGDFSNSIYSNGTPVQVYVPNISSTLNAANCQVSTSMISPNCISPSAQALLQYIPLPNLNTTTNNFHYVTSDNTSSDAVNIRLVHNFGAAQGGPTIMFGPMGMGMGGGGGGRRRASNNISFGLGWSRNNTATINPFPSLEGNTNTQGLNANAGWTYGKGKMSSMFRVNYNHNHVSTTNLYQGSVDVAGLAGIGGVSTNPFDYGIPTISFSSGLSGLSDPMPRRELDQTYTISETLAWFRAKHNWRFGADYRRILQSFESARNAEGSFTFSGFATSENAGGLPVANTGYDFADFLLGLPQLTSLQSGTSAYNFAANSWDLFVQDDWRIRPSLSILWGARYEFQGPFSEAQNHITNLDVTSGFSSATPVIAGETGALSGTFPNSLIKPNYNDWAPRIGLAWRPIKNTVVRTGYGINYNLAQFSTMVQNFAFQPPFAISATNFVTIPGALTFANGFPATVDTVTNNFAVDPNYRLGQVQIWNLDIQHTFSHGILVNIGYNGSKGTHLDEMRAISIPGVQAFNYESSSADSIFHAATVRVRKRMAHGIGIGGSYTFSKSIDDASSVGGGGVTVAQNPFDIAADRSLSSFNQTHNFQGNWIYELPFGENHKYLERGAWSHILSAWQWSGNWTIASGTPLTPYVSGDALGLSRGVSGSVRANVTGQAISLANPTAAEWFNTAAFCVPVTTSTSTTTSGTSNTCMNPSGSPYGDAGRNIIIGPGQVSFNMNLSKTITIKESRSLELRVQASNIFNTVQYTSISTVVNSFNFGQVTAAGNMRRLTLLTRFRF